MSVNEKMTAIADAIRDKTGKTEPLTLDGMASGVNEVYEAGQSSMVDESKIIEKTVSGAFISLDDVSEIPHSVACKVSGVDNLTSVEVTKCGKNLFDTQGWYNWLRTFTTEYVQKKVVDGISCIYYRPALTYDKQYMLGEFKENTQYIIQWRAKGIVGQGESTGFVFNYTDGTRQVSAVKNEDKWDNYTLVSLPDKTLSWIDMGYNYGQGCYIDENSIQLEEGSTATTYEPYNGQKLTPNADGIVEGMTSSSPYMHVFTNNAGATLEVTYRKSWGIQTEYDRFWDDYQQNGDRTNYTTAFGSCWNAENFKPKYPIRPKYASYMFFSNNGGGIVVEDFVEFCENNNIVLDLSNCVSGTYIMGGALQTKHLGVLDFSKCTNMNYAFYAQNGSYGVVTIDEFISSEVTTYINNTFQYATKLANIKISGVIASDIWFQASPLTAESVKSIILALKDYTGTDNEFNYTLTLSGVAKENIEAEGATSPNGNTWLEYAGDKKWNVA